MGKAKCKCPPPGAPDWMLTYGDMMTLLMCFFVLLVAMSIITETKLIAALGSFKKHLGFLPQHLRVLAVLKNTNVARKIQEVKQNEGVDGEKVKVQTVREGEKITIGGKALFNPGSAELLEDAIPILNKIAKMVRGYPNLLMITGHTASSPPLATSKYDNNWQLSWARAMAVGNYLIQEGEINPSRLRIIGASKFDPVDDNVYATGQGNNRRVEILVSNKVSVAAKKYEEKTDKNE